MDPGFESSQRASSSGPMRLCGFCQKPFLKETSYNRHVSYCRRAQNRPRTRVRSCRACSMAKVKCNFQSRCLRCTNKGLECVYDNSKATPTASHTCQVADEQPAENVALIFSPVSSTGSDITGTLNDLYASSGATDTDDAQVDIDWDVLDFTAPDILSQSTKSNLPRSHEPAQVTPNRPFHHSNRDGRYSVDGLNSNFDPESVSFTKPLFWSTWTLRDEYLSALSVPAYFSERQDSDFLVPVPISDPVSNFTANIIMQMLRAFPQMMLRRETLPPFIHGHWHRPSSATEPALPQPLVNCMGIAQLFASHSPETRSFLWRTVKMEQRSSVEKTDQRQFSKDELLAAVQAQLIYIMMRVIDNSKTEPGLNLEFLVTYQGFCESFRNLCKQSFCQNERLYPSSSWEDWVFAESRRRTVIVWILIAQMFHIKIGVPCDIFEGFRDIPLCSPKSLWEARTRSAWQSEYELYKTMPRMGLELFGDLIDAFKRKDVSSNKLKLDAWNATVDNLGVLLSLGAAII